jgi:hypothetical protein
MYLYPAFPAGFVIVPSQLKRSVFARLLKTRSLIPFNHRYGRQRAAAIFNSVQHEEVF